VRESVSTGSKQGPVAIPCSWPALRLSPCSQSERALPRLALRFSLRWFCRCQPVASSGGLAPLALSLVLRRRRARPNPFHNALSSISLSPTFTMHCTQASILACAGFGHQATLGDDWLSPRTLSALSSIPVLPSDPWPVQPNAVQTYRQRLCADPILSAVTHGYTSTVSLSLGPGVSATRIVKHGVMHV